ncbi:MAG: RNA-binding protein, partial [Bacteroidota bacterium]
SASEATPLELFYDDFDENGSVDPLVSYYIQGKSYPDITRDELLRQLGGLRATFTSYESYADVSLSEAIGKNRLKKAGHLSINHLSTSIFLSQEDGTYSLSALPKEVQYAPVHTIKLLDVNQDGKKDLLLCGNDNHTKLRMGKMDANYGMLMLGEGIGSFSYVPQTRSGLRIKGDVRSALFMDNKLILGMNAGPMLTYTLNSQLLSAL